MPTIPLPPAVAAELYSLILQRIQSGGVLAIGEVARALSTKYPDVLRDQAELRMIIATAALHAQAAIEFDGKYPPAAIACAKKAAPDSRGG